MENSPLRNKLVWSIPWGSAAICDKRWMNYTGRGSFCAPLLAWRARGNFVLTPDMVGRVKPAGKPLFAFNALRFSSVLATILLLVSVVGEWLAFSGPAAAPVAMMNEPSSEAISLPPEAALLPAATLESSELSRSAPQQPSAKAPDAPQGTPTPTGEVSLFAAPAMETTPDLSSTLDGSGMGSAMVAETPTLEATPMIRVAR